MPSADDTRPDAPEPPSGPVERPGAEPLDLSDRLDLVEADNRRLHAELAAANSSVDQLHGLVRRLLAVVEVMGPGPSPAPRRRTRCASARSRR